MSPISFRKHRGEKRKLSFFRRGVLNNLFTLIIKVSILFACVIITLRARASSVFPSSYRNTIFSQSTRVFS